MKMYKEHGTSGKHSFIQPSFVEVNAVLIDAKRLIPAVHLPQILIGKDNPFSQAVPDPIAPARGSGSAYRCKIYLRFSTNSVEDLA